MSNQANTLTDAQSFLVDELNTLERVLSAHVARSRTASPHEAVALAFEGERLRLREQLLGDALLLATRDESLTASRALELAKKS